MLTEVGRAGRQDIEDRTDMLAERPWQALGDDGSARLRALAWPLSDLVVRNGGIPTPNPLGLAWP